MFIVVPLYVIVVLLAGFATAGVDGCNHVNPFCNLRVSHLADRSERGLDRLGVWLGVEDCGGFASKMLAAANRSAVGVLKQFHCGSLRCGHVCILPILTRVASIYTKIPKNWLTAPNPPPSPQNAPKAPTGRFHGHYAPQPACRSPQQPAEPPHSLALQVCPPFGEPHQPLDPRWVQLATIPGSHQPGFLGACVLV